jgi:hypothetical protein
MAQLTLRQIRRIRANRQNRTSIMTLPSFLKSSKFWSHLLTGAGAAIASHQIPWQAILDGLASLVGQK